MIAVEWCDLATVLKRWAGLKGGIYPRVREYLERERAEVCERHRSRIELLTVAQRQDKDHRAAV